MTIITLLHDYDYAVQLSDQLCEKAARKERLYILSLRHLEPHGRWPTGKTKPGRKDTQSQIAQN